MRAWIIGIAAFVLWSAGSTYWYVCRVKGLCWTGPSVVVAAVDSISGDGTGVDSVRLAEDSGQSTENETEGDGESFTADSGPGSHSDAGADSEPTTNPEAGMQMKPGSNAHTGDKTNPASNPKSATGATTGNPRPASGKTGSGIGAPGERTILFAFATPQLGNASLGSYLDQWAAFLESNPRKKIRLRGYTDDTAARENNLKLAQRRCDAIADMLRQRGVPDAQIVTEPMGEADPVATNDTPEGRSRNRRVVISLNE